MVLGREHGLDDDFGDARKHEVVVVVAQVRLWSAAGYPQVRDQALGPFAHFGRVVADSEPLRLLVDAVVREVREAVAQLLFVQRELVRAEAREAVLVEVYPQRVQAADEDVDPQVELESVDEQRVGDVLADDELLALAVSRAQSLASVGATSAMLLVTNMPLPCELAFGLTM